MKRDPAADFLEIRRKAYREPTYSLIFARLGYYSFTVWGLRTPQRHILLLWLVLGQLNFQSHPSK